MNEQSKFRKFMSLFSLGFMGGTIYLVIYLRYVFYEQMMAAFQCTNAQLGFLNSAAAMTNLIILIPGSYLADKLEAKKTLIFSIGGVALTTFIYAAFVTSYTVAVGIWVGQSIIMAAYWACLIKYINNLGGEDNAGGSFGTYYLINGLSGAFGNAFPLWISKQFGSFRIGVITIGIILLVATILVILFLDDEKKLAERGIYLKGDEPIRVKHLAYLLKWPGTYLLFLANFTTFMVYTNVSYFNPYLINVIGIDPDASSMISVIRSYGTMLVAPVGGYMCDKVFKSSSKWFMAAFTTIGILFAITLLFGPESNQTLVSIYSIVPSLVIMALYSVTYSIIRELHIPTEISGTAIGLGTLSVNVVNLIFPGLFGGFLDKYGNTGYTMIFVVLIINCVVGALVAFCARRHDKACKAGKRKLDLTGLN